MKKSTAILVSLLALGFPVQAEKNPVALLPGMRPADQLMPATIGMPTFPLPVISEVTNYPNPFDSRKSGIEGQTELAWALSGDYNTTVTLYDLTGGKVRSWSFRSGENGAKMGLNTLRWDGTNESGQKVSKGGYIAMLETEAPKTVATAIRKIAVIH